MNGRQSVPLLIRLTKVTGFGERFNDIVYGTPTTNVEKPNIMVFFGGDVQDFTENMLSHKKNKEYVNWNLENMAQLLQSTFLESHIVVVNSARKDFETYSCYENFVPCSKYGVPNHTPMHQALAHLEKLLFNIQERLIAMTEHELFSALQFSKKRLTIRNLEKWSGVKEESLDALKTDPNVFTNYELKLVGFSKGCVVLNQFLHEFHYSQTSTTNDTSLPRIISKIKDMFWLDGGHSGKFNTWMTSRPLLETLTGLGIRIHVHVTPYQIEDKHRPWIKKEESIFRSTLLELGAPISHNIHFSDVQPSLEIHFNVLEVFGKC